MVVGSENEEEGTYKGHRGHMDDTLVFNKHYLKKIRRPYKKVNIFNNINLNKEA